MILGNMIAALGSWNSVGNSEVWNRGGGAIAHTTSGEIVTPDSAMQLSAYYACIRNISEDIGKLPLILYERTGNGKQRATTRPIYHLVHRSPNPMQTAIEFREQVTAWAAGYGYGYAEIERGASGEALRLWPIHPSRVEKVKTDGTYFYRVMNNGASAVIVPDSNMIVISGCTVFGDGKSALRFRAESLGVSLAAQTFAAAYYGNGMGISMAIIHPGKLSPTAQQNMRESWSAMHQGAGKAHTPFIGEEGMKIEKISIPANEAQFLETRVFQIEEICRWFRMPPHKIQHLQRAAGWSTLESANTDYVVDTLMPWAARWEQELSRKLLFESEQDSYLFEFLFEGLLRGDTAARAAFYNTMFQIGALSSNDIRERENLNPRDGGDNYYTPGNLMTDAQRDKAAQPEPAPSLVPAVEPADEEDDNASRAMMPVMADSLRRVIGKEVKQLKAAAAKHKTDPGAFNKWADDSYATHAVYMAGVLQPCIDAATATHGLAVDASAFIAQHIEDSRNAIEDAYAFDRINEMCEQWQTVRLGSSVQFLALTLFPTGSK